MRLSGLSTQKIRPALFGAGVVAGAVIAGVLTSLVNELALTIGIFLVTCLIFLGCTVLLCVESFRRGMVLAASTVMISSVGWCVSHVSASEWFESRARKRGDAVSVALERYYARVGEFPSSLELLVPGDLEQLPSTGLPGDSSGPFSYDVRESGQDYTISFPGQLLTSCSRAANTSWRCAD